MTDKLEQVIHSVESSVIEELPAHLTPMDALKKLAHLPFPVLLDSSLGHPQLGKASYVLVDPFEFEIVPTARRDHLRRMDELVNTYRVETIPDLPEFQGGLVNLCSYSLNALSRKHSSAHKRIWCARSVLWFV